jgi:hypothetical protein
MTTPARKTSRPTARKVAAVPAKTARSAPARKKTARPVIEPAVRPVAPVPMPAAASPPSSALAKAVKAPKSPKAPKPEKQRVKLVRDSFAMPEADFALIDMLKARAIAAKRPAKKSELLRAGLKALTGLTPTQLAAALEALTRVKTGRPKKGH